MIGAVGFVWIGARAVETALVEHRRQRDELGNPALRDADAEVAGWRIVSVHDTVSCEPAITVVTLLARAVPRTTARRGLFGPPYTSDHRVVGHVELRCATVRGFRTAPRPGFASGGS